MSPRGIVFLTACWLLFIALFAVQFLSLGLIPVLAPVCSAESTCGTGE
jgi:hypothetical protein